MTDVRIERDCLGEMEIPNDQYYGIQTHRMEKVSGTANLPVIFYPDMHYALAQIKKAAAIAQRQDRCNAGRRINGHCSGLRRNADRQIQ